MTTYRGNLRATSYKRKMLGIRHGREFPQETQPKSVASDESEDDFDPEDEVDVDWIAEFLSITQWLEKVTCHLPPTIPIGQPDVERLFKEFAEYPLVSELLLEDDVAVSEDMNSTVIVVGIEDDVMEDLVEEVEEEVEVEEVEQNDPSIRSALPKTMFTLVSEPGDCLVIDQEVKFQPASENGVPPSERLVVHIPDFYPLL
jgi:hypothetical protein